MTQFIDEKYYTNLQNNGDELLFEIYDTLLSIREHQLKKDIEIIIKKREML